MPPTQTIRGTPPPGRAARWLQRTLLERRYGMPRGALQYVDLRDLGFDAPDRVHEHIASPWGVLGRILPRREVSSEDVFIDIGCGMGPVLVEAAARYRFRRTIGIDIVPQFTEVAEQTIARGRDHLRCRNVEVLTGDIAEYGLPDDVTVVFMADPFRGPVFDSAVAKIVASVDRNPRVIRLVYSNPVEGGRLERTGRARLVRLGRRKGRRWTTAPDLAMYEITPASGAGGDGRRPARPLPRRLLARPSGPPARAPEHPTIQARSGASGTRAVWTGEDGDLESLRAAFEHEHCVRLPSFLDDALLDRIRGYVDEGEFSIRTDDALPPELAIDESKAGALLFLLLNDADLFKLVRDITGCRRIGRFEGDLYRTPPGPEHVAAWHGDIFGHGMVSMSIDVSDAPYAGGVLELRDRHSEKLLHRAESGPGDAVLARVAPFLQQRLTPVEGDVPRTVYGGRFMLSRSGADSKLAGVGTPAASSG